MQIDRFNGTQHAIVVLVVDDFGNLVSLNDSAFDKTFALDSAARFIKQDH